MKIKFPNKELEIPLELEEKIKEVMTSYTGENVVELVAGAEKVYIDDKFFCSLPLEKVQRLKEKVAWTLVNEWYQK